MMCFPSVGTRLISQKKCSSLHLLLQWMATMPSFWNCNTVYRNCTVLCDTILHNVSQSHRITLNQKRSHWLLVVIVWLGFILLSSWSSEDQHQPTTQLLWRLGLLWARTTSPVVQQHEASQKLQVENFSVPYFNKDLFYFFPRLSDMFARLYWLPLVNKSFLAQTFASREVPGFTAWPWIMYKRREGALHKTGVFTKWNIKLSFEVWRAEKPSEFYCPRPTCARFRPNDKNQDLPETPGHWGRAQLEGGSKIHGI